MLDIDSSEPLWVIHLKRTLNLTHERNHGQKMLLIAQEKTPSYFA
jgi:hypothetical protein